MQATVSGIMVAATVTDESVNRTTGEQIKSRGEIYFLTSERGRPVVKTITCRPRTALSMSADNLEVGGEVAEKTFEVDVTQWEVNGRSGVSVRLVEEDLK